MEKGLEQQTREGLEEHTHERMCLAVDPQPSHECCTVVSKHSSERKSKDQKMTSQTDARIPDDVPTPPE